MKINSLNLHELNQELIPYLYKGYDLYFVHGWFSAYVSSPSDSEDDLVIPTYLILNEDSVTDEHRFAKLIDKLMTLYTILADSVFENNKQLRPLIDLARPNTFDPANLALDQKRNLLMWLYGYLTGYLVIDCDVTECVVDKELLDKKFYPALFTLCVALFSLYKEVPLDFMEASVREDFKELVLDLKAMWEGEDHEREVDQLIDEAIINLDLADIVSALNNIFYVVRVSDEDRFTSDKPSISKH